MSQSPSTKDNHVLLAAGLNAHSQLSPSSTADRDSFQPLPSPGRLLLATWSTTTLVSDATLTNLGHEHATHSLAAEVSATLHSAFGDHEGLLGCLSTAGALYTHNASTNQLERQGDDSSPKLGLAAVAGNGKAAITFEQAPNGRLCHLLLFDTFDDFLAWFHDPAATKLEAERQHHMLPGRPKQLVAGTGTFLLLMEDGEVYSWGDPRYRSLGRDIADVPAELPSVVDALAGLRIDKVSAGGWMSAALSGDRAAYVWGTGLPGTDRLIKCLREADGQDVVLVDLDDGLDVVDIAVAEGHIAMLVDGKRLFVAGENRNGQLGLDDTAASFVDDWTEVRLENRVNQIFCGPKSTFVSIAPS